MGNVVEPIAWIVRQEPGAFMLYRYFWNKREADAEYIRQTDLQPDATPPIPLYAMTSKSFEHEKREPTEIIFSPARYALVMGKMVADKNGSYVSHEDYEMMIGSFKGSMEVLAEGRRRIEQERNEALKAQRLNQTNC